jgi:hypothetical protein
MSFKSMEEAKRWADVLNNRYGLPLNQLLDEKALIIKDKNIDSEVNQ